LLFLDSVDPQLTESLPGCTRDVDSAQRRLAHLMLGTFVALAAAGLLGGGPWPMASVERAEVRVEYARVLHLYEPSPLRVHIDRVDASTLEIELASTGGPGLALEGVSPPPVSQRGVPDGVRLEIAARPGHRSDVELRLLAHAPGWRRTVLRLPTDQLVIDQLVLP
jgi:hypothetical protein